jgi:hypothetical protein
MSRAVAYPVPAMMTMSHQFFIKSLMYGRSWLIEIRLEELLFESDMRLQFRYDLEKKQCRIKFLMQSTSFDLLNLAFH